MNVKRILIVQPALRAAAYAFVGTALPALGFPVEIAVLAHFFVLCRSVVGSNLSVRYDALLINTWKVEMIRCSVARYHPSRKSSLRLTLPV